MSIIKNIICMLLLCSTFNSCQNYLVLAQVPLPVQSPTPKDVENILRNHKPHNLYDLKKQLAHVCKDYKYSKLSHLLGDRETMKYLYECTSNWHNRMKVDANIERSIHWYSHSVSKYKFVYEFMSMSRVNQYWGGGFKLYFVMLDDNLNIVGWVKS